MRSNEQIKESIAKPERIHNWYEGLIERNPVLVSGMIIAPAVIVANNLQDTLLYAFVFTFVTFITIMVASYIPRNIVYTVRIILYVIIAALVYAVMAALFDFQEDTVLRIFLPLTITNGLIVSKSERRFFKLTKGKMMLEAACNIVGFDAAILLIAAIRELFGKGALMGNEVNIVVHIPALSEPFGGFILIGILAAFLRYILTLFDKQKREGN